MTGPNDTPQTRSSASDRSTPNGSVAPRARRRAISDRARAGGSKEGRKRTVKALAISIGAHVVVAVVLFQLITFGHGLSSFLNLGRPDDALEERVTYVATETPKPAVTPDLPQAEPPTEPRAAASPPTISSPGVTSGAAVEAPRNAPSPRADTGSGRRPDGTGNGVGEIDPNLKGVKPAYGDARVWQGPVGNGVAPGRDGADRLDSVMGFAITSARDSLDSLARSQGKYGRAPGDWTKTDANGNKWGWDNAGIRLGKVVIPNALLSLLPLNTQVGMSGNFTAMERERRLSMSRADILRMSERSLGEAEFRKLANELRDRRERERRDRLKAPSAPSAPVFIPPDKNNR